MIACKKCRRAGEKLFLKGERCFLPKCAIVKKNYPPGQHGSKSQRRLTDYGYQLSIKQKIKNTYGIDEKQLKNYFKKVKNKQGNIGEMLLQEIEKRLDNIIYRSGLGDSRRQSRQMVSHGFFVVNGKKVDIASFQVKAGDEIIIKESKQKKELISEKIAKLKKENNPAEWIMLDPAKGRVKVLAIPTMEDIKGVGNIQMIVEYYSR